MKNFWVVLLITILMTQVGYAAYENPETPSEADSLKHYTFLRAESLNDKKKYRYNEFEDIISGAAAFVVGNIGFFSVDSKVLKLGYSGIQTIGIVNIGKGIYDYYRPLVKAQQQSMLKNYQSSDKKSTMEYFSKEILKTLAQEERAKRLSLFYGSTLLTVQYGINVSFGNTPKSLKNIYYFLGGVNAIVALYTYFFPSKIEEFIYQNRSVNLFAGLSETNIPTLNLTWNF